MVQSGSGFGLTLETAESLGIFSYIVREEIQGNEAAQFDVFSLLADEYLQTDISGYVQNKATGLKEYFEPLAELIKAGKFRWEVYERKDEQVRMFGDCAVVVGTLDLKGSGARPTSQHTWVADPNATFSGTLHFTHVYINRNGKWLLAGLHNQLPPGPPPINNQ